MRVGPASSDSGKEEAPVLEQTAVVGRTHQHRISVLLAPGASSEANERPERRPPAAARVESIEPSNTTGGTWRRVAHTVVQRSTSVGMCTMHSERGAKGD